jgi:hypothetical protein
MKSPEIFFFKKPYIVVIGMFFMFFIVPISFWMEVGSAKVEFFPDNKPNQIIDTSNTLRVPILRKQIT